MACQISVQYTRNSFDTHTLIRYHSKHLPSGQVRVWSAMKHEMISKKSVFKMTERKTYVPLCNLWHNGYMCVCVCAVHPAGFVRCLQPVLVSRKDPDSRKNTIQEIESRAKSGGHWPQVCQNAK